MRMKFTNQFFPGSLKCSLNQKLSVSVSRDAPQVSAASGNLPSAIRIRLALPFSEFLLCFIAHDTKHGPFLCTIFF